MKVRVISKYIGAIITIAFLFYFINKKEKIIVNESDEEQLENFDLILTNGQSLESKLVNILSLSIKQNYTHIGIAYKEKNKVYILHATPDGAKGNCIRYDKLQAFLDLSNVCDYKILRDENLTTACRYLLNVQLEKYKNLKIPFDYDFNNQEHKYIYCSELVYLIFTKAGLFQTKNFNLSKPINPNFFLSQKELIIVTDRKSTANK